MHVSLCLRQQGSPAELMTAYLPLMHGSLPCWWCSTPLALVPTPMLLRRVELREHRGTLQAIHKPSRRLEYCVFWNAKQSVYSDRTDKPVATQYGRSMPMRHPCILQVE